jgi:hypothetical protein
MTLEPVAIYVLRVVQLCECEEFFPAIMLRPGTGEPGWVLGCARCGKGWALVQKEAEGE